MKDNKSEIPTALAFSGYCHLDTVHRQSDVYYSSQGLSTNNNEIIITKRDLIAGKSWERAALHLGPTKHFYDTDFRKAEISRRVTADSRIITKKDLGMRGSIITEITDYGPSDERTLSFKIDLDGSYLTLNTETSGELRWHWNKPPTLTWNGKPEDIAILENHYFKQKNLLLDRIPLGQRDFNLWIYLDFSIKHDILWQAYAKPQEKLNETFTPEPLPPFINKHEDDLVISLYANYFPTISNGTPPDDIGLFPGIVSSPSGWPYIMGSPIGKDALLCLFRNADSSNTGNNKAAGLSTAIHPLPLATTISSTAGPQKLIANPQSAKPTWSVEKPSAGSIKSIDGAQHYQPPGALRPNAIANPDCKTLIPAMRKSSTRQILLPAVADILKATTSTGAAYATWVSEYFAQTHYFKAAKQSGKLQLSMYYTAMTGKEVAVPLKNIAWHVLSGNGKVDSQGVFTPDSKAPSLCTVILAVDVDETEADQSWYWAMTIIPHPFIEVDAMLELFSD